MNIIISGDLQIVSESATDIVFIHLQKKVGDKAKSLPGMFKWECSSLDFAIKWRRMRLQLQYLCLFWGKPFEERHETADETAATEMQGMGMVSCDERGKHLQLCGQKRAVRGAVHSANVGKALTKGKLWISSLGGVGCGIRAIFVSCLKDFEQKDFKALE